MLVPRIVVAAPRSGEGKTTVALALMAALAKQGFRVQGFKVGPDYLDTSFQELVTGKPGRNLDLWLMGSDAVRQSLQQNTQHSDIAIIEGVMGLFDGHRDGKTPTSTADIAKLTQSPVVLVVDASRMAASVGALAMGFKTFDPEVQLAGVILNRWTPGRSFAAVENALKRAGVPLLGTLEKAKNMELPSRHLGLVGANEQREFAKNVLNNLADQVIASVDLHALFQAARTAATFSTPQATTTFHQKEVRLGIARDNAFSFYYPENLEALEAAGAELVFFSPCRDTKLPPNLDGIYFGGGYPEEHAHELSRNTTFLNSVKTAAASGMPIYAECGGMLYLAKNLTTQSGETWPFVNVIPANTIMRNKLQSMGYRTGTLLSAGFLGAAGTSLRGHEFHYSSIHFETHTSPTYRTENGDEGYSQNNITCSYLHLHFAGNPHIAFNFVCEMKKFRDQKRNQEIP